MLRKAIETIFVQRGKWWSPGGSARRFDSSVSDFTATWYPGKLNSLTFHGKIGEQARDFLINLCVAMSISTEPRENVHDQTEPRTSMEKFSMDLEILQSRFDSLQSLISTHNDLLTGANDLVNEVTRLRLELEEEKAKTFMLEQQIKILSEKVMKSKPGICQASPIKNTVSTLETNNTVHGSTISENNGLQTKDVNSSILTTHLASQVNHNSAQSLLIYEPVNMQIPTTVNTFNQQVKDYKMKHVNQRTKKQTCSDPPKVVNKRPGRKITPSLDLQLKDYRSKYNGQRLISTTSHQPNNRINNMLVFGQNQQHANRRELNNINKGYSVDHLDKPPTLHFHQQLKQYREKQQISFFRITHEKDATLSNTTQNKDVNSRQRLNDLKHTTNLYPFRKYRRIIRSYRTVHRHQS